MTPISFTIFGTAQPKGSTRAFKRGDRIVVTSDNPNLAGWEQLVRDEAKRLVEKTGHTLMHGAIDLAVTFYLPRPKSVSPRVRPFPTVRPDLSKAVRALEDPLSGVLWTDDAQVIQISARKLYTDGPAKAVVTVRQVLTLHDLFIERPPA